MATKDEFFTAARLTLSQRRKLDALAAMLSTSRSEILRQLVDHARVVEVRSQVAGADIGADVTRNGGKTRKAHAAAA
jgi:hypothetical protein